MTDKEIRILRYHLSSGHVLCEKVDESITVADATDDHLLVRTSNVLADESTAFITITEVISDSRVLVRKASIDFIQVTRATPLFSEEEIAEAEGAEESAMRRAARRWTEGGHNVG